MDSEITSDVVRRLKSVEGHVRGVRRMVEEGAYCIDVVNQIVAIQRALKKVSVKVLDEHLHSCVTGAIQGGPDGTPPIELGGVICPGRRARP